MKTKRLILLFMFALMARLVFAQYPLLPQNQQHYINGTIGEGRPHPISLWARYGCCQRYACIFHRNWNIQLGKRCVLPLVCHYHFCPPSSCCEINKSTNIQINSRKSLCRYTFVQCFYKKAPLAST